MTRYHTRLPPLPLYDQTPTFVPHPKASPRHGRQGAQVGLATRWSKACCQAIFTVESRRMSEVCDDGAWRNISSKRQRRTSSAYVVFLVMYAILRPSVMRLTNGRYSARVYQSANNGVRLSPRYKEQDQLNWSSASGIRSFHWRLKSYSERSLLVDLGGPIDAF